MMRRSGSTQMSMDASSVTADDFLQMGDGSCELICGEVIALTPAGWEHGEIANEIAYHLNVHVRSHQLGRVGAAETGFILTRNPDTVRAPDVAFVRQERWVHTSGFFPGAPDLAVEVISPHDRFSEVNQKVRDWLLHGAQEVWAVDPNRRVIQVFRRDGTMLELSGTDVIEGGELLPGFRLAVRDCFPAALREPDDDI